MSRFEKMEIRLKELETRFHELFQDVRSNSQHPWHKQQINPSKKCADSDTQELLRLEKEIALLRDKLMLDDFRLPNLRPDDKQRPRSDFKISSIPRDHIFAINENELKQQHRRMIEADLPIFEAVHFSSPVAGIEEELLAHIKYNPQSGNALLTLYPVPRDFLDEVSRLIFVRTLFPQLLAFQVHVRDDPQFYKRTHQQAFVYWMDNSWYRSQPESLPDAIDLPSSSRKA